MRKMSTILSSDILHLIQSYLDPVIQHFTANSLKSSRFLLVPPDAVKSLVIKPSAGDKEVKVLMKGAQGYGWKFCKSSDNPIFFDDSSLGEMFPAFKECKYYLMYFNMYLTTARMFVDKDETELVPYNGSGILLSSDSKFNIKIEKLANLDGGYCCMVCLKAQWVKKIEISLLYGSYIASRLYPGKLGSKNNSIQVINRCITEKYKRSSIADIINEIEFHHEYINCSDVRHVFIIPDLVIEKKVDEATADESVHLNVTCLNYNLKSLIDMVNAKFPESKIYIQNFHPNYCKYPADVVEEYNKMVMTACGKYNCTYIDVCTLFHGCSVSFWKICSKAVKILSEQYKYFITCNSTSQVLASNVTDEEDKSEELPNCCDDANTSKHVSVNSNISIDKTIKENSNLNSDINETGTDISDSWKTVAEHHNISKFNNVVSTSTHRIKQEFVKTSTINNSTDICVMNRINEVSTGNGVAVIDGIHTDGITRSATFDPSNVHFAVGTNAVRPYNKFPPSISNVNPFIMIPIFPGSYVLPNYPIIPVTAMPYNIFPRESYSVSSAPDEAVEERYLATDIRELHKVSIG